MNSIGQEIHSFAKKLWPINRSLTGNGVRETLAAIKEHLPELTVHEVPSGTQVFDWTIPNEWNVTDAWIEDSSGKKIVDFKTNNLHLVGYSISVDQVMELEDLQKHLYSLPDQPEAIPYITSYYSSRWGFSLTDNQRKKLVPGKYRVYINSSLKPGFLTYGELIIPGLSKKEIFLSTYICHPSMANNELSGPCVTTFLAKWITNLKKRNYTYRIIFIPETIGSITYLSRNIEEMKKHIVAGFNITCIGDNRAYSYLPSRDGQTLADRAALHALKYHAKDFKCYTFLDRGSDERQYCSPGVDLPVATIMRSKYAEYPEYHTSLDDLSLVTSEGLQGGFEVLQKAISILENNVIPQMTVLGEPQLGKRGLYPTLSTKETHAMVRAMMDLIAYSDGKRTLLEIAELINRSMEELIPIYHSLAECGLIRELKEKI